MTPLLLAALLACKSPEDTGAVADTKPVEPPWPEWAWQHWVWEDESTAESALTLVDDYLDHDIPVGAIIIDSPWATGYSTFAWDTGLFPDAQGMIDELHARDVRVMLWTVPLINVDVPDLYAEAAEKGYFLTDADGAPVVLEWWKGDGSLIDYFNPEAVDWWHDLLQPILDQGIDGWKCDGGEYGMLLEQTYSAAAGRKIERLEYSRAYYQDFFDHTRAVLGEDRLITARPIDNYGADFGGDVVSFAPIEASFAAWVGDQDPDFEGLKAALRNLYWSSDYGYLAAGSDIGGYRTDGSDLGREKETFVRWTQAATFTPVMENGGGGEHRPWMFDTETADIYRAQVELHHALLPILRDQGAVAWQEGRPLMTFLSDDSYAWMLGDDLFITPILEPGGAVRVAFPSEGQWRHLYAPDATYDGGDTIDMTLPLDAYPAFVRVGSDMEQALIGR